MEDDLVSRIRNVAGLNLPSGLMSVGVQLQLAAVGTRIGVIERLEDRDGAAIFNVCLQRESGKGRGELAVPYMAHEGRTVIIGMLLAVGSGRHAEWQAGGRPRRGTRAIAYYGLDGEHCVIRWCQQLIDRRRALLEAGGFNFGNVERLASRRHRETAMLVHGGCETTLPEARAAEKIEEALAVGHAACSRVEAECMTGALQGGLQLVVAENDDSVSAADELFLLRRSLDLDEIQGARRTKRRGAPGQQRRLAA